MTKARLIKLSACVNRQARQFARDIHCGMVGVNVGVPAPMALFPFAGWGQAFFGDLHVQGSEGVRFYTCSKVVLSRWQCDGSRLQGWQAALPCRDDGTFPRELLRGVPHLPRVLPSLSLSKKLA